MNKALSKAGLHVTNDTGVYNSDEELENLASIEKTPFRDIFEEYAKLRADEGMFNLGI